MVMAECNWMLEGVITSSRCDSPQRAVKDVRKICQLVEICDARGRNVQELGKV